MRIVFRADASRDMGSGHIMRCLTLAESLDAIGAQCSFAVRPGSQETVPALAEAGYELIVLKAEAADEAEALRRHRPDGVDWLVVDHYGRDRTFEAACRPWARGIMVLDDLADRNHDCDLLLDQTLGRKTGDYDGLLPPACRKLLGTRYALLRPEFRKLRQGRSKSAASSQAPLRLLVTLGGTDPDNLTGVCIDAIERSGIRASVDV
ncbi:MAG TPA: UDP-2,4-diacetamido-2,4,6-trideoxy-beta-L-altropyranose hydrolase, partial [Kiloniellaceae bacterium]|nr:UDP-2,4-diacetamido-2,4,6-trideoxy-beta-L-altropyranose hydrolase [Kiloniellaceae bacterium]